jgi:5-methylcytosine-specific restriction endonuclease McrA
VDYTARQPSGYCNRCQDRRWAADSRHKRRAWKAKANVVDVISPDVVFKRDGYRCQICQRKTRGTFPNLMAPTIDHIVPLALGGDHSYLNVQCACFGCNSRKGAHGAGDQLRLVA